MQKLSLGRPTFSGDTVGKWGGRVRLWSPVLEKEQGSKRRSHLPKVMQLVRGRAGIHPDLHGTLKAAEVLLHGRPGAAAEGD